MPTVPEQSDADWLAAPSRGGEPSDADWLQEGSQLEASALGVVVDKGTQLDANRASRILRMNTRTGLPTDLIDRNLDEIERQTKAADFDGYKFRRESPIVASWIAEHPEHAAIAREDFDRLGFLERGFKAIGKGFEQGGKTNLLGRYGFGAIGAGVDTERDPLIRSLNRDLADVPGGDSFAARWLYPASKIAGQVMESVGASADEGLVGGLLGAGVVAAASVGPQALATPVTVPGGFVAGVGIGLTTGLVSDAFKIEAGHQYLELGKLRDENGQPLDEFTRKSASYATGFINAGLELVAVKIASAPFKAAAKKLITERLASGLATPTVRAAVTTFGKEYAKAVGGELLTEEAQEVTGILAADLAKLASTGEFDTVFDSPEEREAALVRLIDTGSEVVRGMSIVGLAGPGVNLAVDVRRARQAKEVERFFVALADGSKESKLVKRMPEKAQEVIERMTMDGPVETVGLPVETFTEYFQSKGLDPSEVAKELTGDAAAYSQAVAAGTDISVPTARYGRMIAATEHGGYFAREVRFRPTDMNGREAEEFEAELKRIREQDAQEQAEPSEDVASRVSAMLEGAGFDRDSAGRQALLLGQVFQSLGTRAGVDPMELFERYRLSVERRGPEQGDVPLVQDDPGADFEGKADDRSPLEAGLFNRSAVAEFIRERPEFKLSAREDFDLAIEAHESITAEDPNSRTENLETRALAVSEEFFQELTVGQRSRLKSLGVVVNTDAAKQQADLVGERVYDAAVSEAVAGESERLQGVVGRVVADETADPNVRLAAWLHENAPRREAQDAPLTVVDTDTLDDGDKLTIYGHAFEVERGEDGRALVGESAVLPLEGVRSIPVDAGSLVRTSEPMFQPAAEAGAEGSDVEAAAKAWVEQGVESPWFKRWFGASKVVDAEGKPLVLYHGGPTFDAFREGVNHATDDPDAAAGYADQRERSAREEIKPLYLRLLNPLDLRDHANFEKWVGVPVEQKTDGSPNIRQMARHSYPMRSGGKTLSDIRNAGYDGVIFHDTDVYNRGAMTSYAFFDPTSAKLAPDMITGEAGTFWDKPVRKEGNRGTFDPSKPSILFQPAFHGSPHSFDRFDLSKIGTGEGAQVYGWGLYFAGRRGVAEYYRNQIKDPVKLKEINDELSMLSRKMDEHRAGEYGKFKSDEGYKLKEQYDQLLDQRAKMGRIYTVEIPEDDQYLNHDLPLSQQSEFVKNALRDAPLFQKMTASRKVETEAFGAVELSEITGGQLYGMLAVEMSKPITNESGKLPDWMVGHNRPNDEAASRYLASLGIAGIKYLDDGSRNVPAFTVKRESETGTHYSNFNSEAEANAAAERYRAEGFTQVEVAVGDRSYNYVVFDDKLIDVIEYEQRQLNRTKKGYIRIAADRKVSIALLEKADLSTFLHESGHFFLEVLGDLATGENAPTQLVDDYATILKWFGVDGRDKIGVEQHEKFARGFEAYLFEGKAPSEELRTAFARFRAWLVSVYKSLAGLNIRLNDDVRAVMDRLVATDEQIEAAQNAEAVSPLFTDAASAGMSDVAFEAYRGGVERESLEAREKLTQKVMAGLKREQTAVWKAERDRVRAVVEKEVHGRREYVALANLQRGKLPDGSPLPEGVVALKLDRKALIDRRSKEYLERLPRGVTARGGGVSEDFAAEQFGYGSGDEMLSAIISAPRMEQSIKGEVARRMAERFPDPALQGDFAEQAAQAVHGEGRAKIIRAEVAALNGLARAARPAVRAADAERKAARSSALTGIPPVAAVRDFARRALAGKPVRRVKPSLYRAAMRSNARAAFAALAKDDYAAAAGHKVKELTAQELHTEAVRIVEDADKIVQYMRRFARKEVRARIGKAGGGFLEQIDAIVERYDFAKSSGVAVERRVSLREFLKDKEGHAVPDDVIDDARRIRYGELSHEFLTGLYDAVKNLHHMATHKNKLLKQKKDRQFAEARDEAVASIQENVPPLPPSKIAAERSGFDRAAARVAGGLAAHRKLSSWARQMDGGESGGVVWELLPRPLNEAADEEVVMRREVGAALDKLQVEWQKSGPKSLSDRVYIPSIGKSLNLESRMMVFLNWGNEGNRERLMSGEGWSQSQVNDILRTLDEADLRFGQGIFDLIESYRPLVGAKHKRVTGLEPDWVEATEIATAFGRFRGGYFAVKYDRARSPIAEKNEAAGKARLYQLGQATAATTRRSHLKERTQGLGKPLLLSLDAVSQHLAEVIHDLTHHEAIIDINRLLNDEAFSTAVQEHLGPAALRRMNGVVADVAASDLSENEVDRTIRWLRNGVSVSRLGFRFSTALMQVTGFSQSMQLVGVRPFLSAVRRVFHDPARTEGAFAFVSGKSRFMASRDKTQTREMFEALNRIRGGRWTENINHYAFYMTVKAQSLVDVPTWMAAYDTALRDGREDADAVAIADQAVIDTQGSGMTKDLSAVQRGQVTSLFTVYYSYFNATFNRTAEAMATAKREGWSPAAVARLATDFVMLYSVPATMTVLARLAMGDDDDEDESIATRLLKEHVSLAMGTMIGLRDLSFTLTDDAMYRGPAGLGGFKAVADAIIQTGQGELDEGLVRAYADVAGIAAHVPTKQAVETIQGFMYLLENPSPDVRPVLFGPPRE